MEETKWERYAALGGFVFVVCNVIGSLLPGGPPTTDDSSVKVASYFKDHAGAIKIGQLLGGLATIGLLWWLGSLWRMMCRAENERPRLAVVAAVSLGMGGVMALLSGAVTTTTALRIDDLAVDPKFFLILSNVMLASAGFFVVAFLGAVSALSYKTKMLPAWTTYLGWLVAALFLVATGGAASESNAFGFLGLGSFLLWCVWIVGVSSFMWKGSATTS